jgi:hypothetical protein
MSAGFIMTWPGVWALDFVCAAASPKTTATATMEDVNLICMDPPQGSTYKSRRCQRNGRPKKYRHLSPKYK